MIDARSGKRTAVLFIDHQTDDESLYRYSLIRDAGRRLGYSVYYALDVGSAAQPKLCPGVDFYCFSYDRFRKLFPHMVYNPQRDPYKNCLPMAVFPFRYDHSGEFDYVWLIEYDVCCGDWTAFFSQYDGNCADLVTSAPSFKSYAEYPGWWAYDWVDKDVMEKLVGEGCVCEGLMCCSRLSDRAFDEICRFYEEFNVNWYMFFEMAWPTSVARRGWKIEKFDSNYFTFKPQLPKDFSDFKPGTLYHPVKFDIEWKTVQDRGL